MKKYISVFLVVLLMFAIFVPVFADTDDSQIEGQEEIMSPICPECGRGSFLKYDTVERGQETETEDCYYEGCIVTKTYQLYEDYYRCTYCGHTDSAERRTLISTRHSINH
ncbi:hypothetical protein EQM13_08850 [Acidilutibacter cellobiosedens]|uniref:Uncharacterized protein n=1 Tax=Acidilutibacter cellobiosedens TaxID=2507161 RepID=A0A410QCG4_9FIRM|nr:hypothetical protein [Acidilutibacter cellobiosedens]MBE6082005.1 hypothetical protein [Tissierellaceae bacterium]QAT61687.1 hypothetical protein EQM13_08850 [Acidilutibacter cellobiosedens]